MRTLSIIALSIFILAAFVATAFSEIRNNSTSNSSSNQNLIPEEKIIEENAINIKKQRIETIAEGVERKIGNVTEIVSKEKIVRKYPSVIVHIVEGNASVAISRGKIKVVQG
jgi:hypothetical protein